MWAMAKELGVLKEIVEAAPTDGLWEDARTDESQLGMSYAELEWAMRYDTGIHTLQVLTPEQDHRLAVYRELHKKNLHKMVPIPVGP